MGHLDGNSNEAADSPDCEEVSAADKAVAYLALPAPNETARPRRVLAVHNLQQRIQP